ncbi:MAG: amidohydrolase family protein [Bacteroidota bacterium]|nr:amidohydrolase family protein [Bacteroidota bacterium]
MSYQKFRADFLFTGTEMLGSHHVVITNEQGIIQSIVPEEEAGEGVHYFEGLLSPGFINTHCHLELSHMRGLIPEHTGLVDFVFNVVTQRHQTNEEIVEAIARAEDEMLTNGIVAVGDICNNAITNQQKRKGRLRYYNFIETMGWLPFIAQQRFETAQKVRDIFSEIPSAIVPHAPYSVSQELWHLIEPGFSNSVISMHNQETADENAFFLNGGGDFKRMYQLMKLDNSFFQPSGKTSLQTVAKHFVTAKNVLLVHNVFTTEEDIQFISNQSKQYDQQFFYCFCVNANTYIQNATPPIELMRRSRCNITLGTDSLASNWSLSLLDEIKAIRLKFPNIPTQELLQWATHNGAVALSLHEELGSFSVGKKPGVILISSLEKGEISPSSSVKRLL